MTLAFIISLCMVCGASSDALAADVRHADIRSVELEEGAGQDSGAKPADSSKQPDSAQNSTTPAQPPAAPATAGKPSAATPSKTATPKRGLRKKKAATKDTETEKDAKTEKDNCEMNAASKPSLQSTSSQNDAASANNSSSENSTAENTAPTNAAEAANTGKTPSKCPPAKVIVRDGGTSEPTVRLTGDAATGPVSPQAGKTDQLLGSTEDNLKKLSGHSLSENQKEMVSQIRQYMEQSKTATAAGDVERGRSLALKANLLSQELTKP